MSRAICVISHTAGIAMTLANGRGDRDLFLSYGQQVPNAVEFDSLSYWMAGAYAARLHRAGLAPKLAAPGWDWMANIDPELAGRKVEVCTLGDLPEGTYFTKPAELKVEGVAAGIWNGVRFVKAALASGADLTMHTQYSEIVAINHEYRFVVREGQVITGSPYLVDGILYGPHITGARYEEAFAFAKNAVAELGENCPVACSLDVGRNEKTGQWLIVEANPLWSSGPYGIEPDVFVDAVEFSNGAGSGRWAWSPDATLRTRAEQAEMMKAVTQEQATGYVAFGA